MLTSACKFFELQAQEISGKISHAETMYLTPTAGGKQTPEHEKEMKKQLSESMKEIGNDPKFIEMMHEQGEAEFNQFAERNGLYCKNLDDAMKELDKLQMSGNLNDKDHFRLSKAAYFAFERGSEQMQAQEQQRGV